MFKFLSCLIALFLIYSTCVAQVEEKSPPTNFDEFVSKHDGFVKIEDFALTRMILQLSYGETRIRKVAAGKETKIYYQVTSGQYSGSVASEDFADLIKAYDNLKQMSSNDVKESHDYLENKYVDKGGLEIGYVVEKKRLTWFVRPHKFGPRTLFLKDPTTMEESLTQGIVVLQKLQ
ncbi:hypothetical protein GCM10007423_39510 [Dyadobacter endophyticus]|uniref:Uncharacterized protein n=1 Tax=Dyadobacter endophyticus TaxID=1749036 RepID=A0ABQ1Z0G8_9BACT|nr:hypothetical protein [Dyadobacter endophyticus]GGH42692.1 hypothetical protein GCM10007423_39510 [Dyadobacter endophyticus]